MSCNQRDRIGYCGVKYCGCTKLKDSDNMVSRDYIDNLRNCLKPRLNAGYICVAGDCKEGTLYNSYNEIPPGAYLNRYCYRIPTKSEDDCCFGKYENELECPDGYYRGSPLCLEHMKKACQTREHKNDIECINYNKGISFEKCKLIKTSDGWKCDTNEQFNSSKNNTFELKSFRPFVDFINNLIAFVIILTIVFIL
jgi:hypothetical protein